MTGVAVRVENGRKPAIACAGSPQTPSQVRLSPFKIFQGGTKETVVRGPERRKEFCSRFRNDSCRFGRWAHNLIKREQYIPFWYIIYPVASHAYHSISNVCYLIVRILPHGWKVTPLGDLQWIQGTWVSILCEHTQCKVTSHVIISRTCGLKGKESEMGELSRGTAAP